MGARSTWNGSLQVGSKKFPVHLYTAVQDQAVHFHMLEARSKQRVKQRMVNPNTGKEVTWDFALKSKLDTMPKDLRWDMKLPVGEPAVAGQTPLI